ncbi:MAG: hypothetical protein ACJ0Q6_04160 [Candidatus Azotimanducaceae bacterium]|uniref:Uncharacterized protein n=1 Tax=OM182 bacterium TaxID=2510334 RepID=A0A520S2C7_9GAMM|nr:hypothetical protein [Gammaproteobacteria bacterium]OUV68227.1 MAG: hypothetical protein CBC93_02550 [Gammaproteobacteria bacterium TMED133]RZO76633.1 MAG: hypothetical protein EVA68_03580 [OM182 bacterium]
MSGEKLKSKSGIFYSKTSSGVIVMFRGEEVFRYKTVEELIEVHIKAINALEEKQEAELEKNYTL